jgi:hypothetical protein
MPGRTTGTIVLLILFSVLFLPGVVSAQAQANGVYFTDTLESDPLPYENLYNEVWNIYASSTFGNPTSGWYRAIWSVVFAVSILAILWGGSAWKGVAWYWILSLLFLTPWMGGRYLYPEICRTLDMITREVEILRSAEFLQKPILLPDSLSRQLKDPANSLRLRE